MTGILIAFPKAEIGQKIKAKLMRGGYQVLGVYTNGARLIQEANSLQRGVVVCSWRLPDMMYAEIKEYLPPDFQMIVILPPGEEMGRQTQDVIGLTQPLQVHSLLSTVEMVVGNLQRLRRRRGQPRPRSEQEMALIRRAKEVLMNRNGMSEPAAHKYLQKTSMDQGLSMMETAQMILAMMDK